MQINDISHIVPQNMLRPETLSRHRMKDFETLLDLIKICRKSSGLFSNMFYFIVAQMYVCALAVEAPLKQE